MKNLVIIFFALSCFFSCTQKVETEKRPNFLFVLVDDQPFDALGAHGRYPFLETPNMDKLAKRGVNFSNFYCTQSICSPSRASFMTGTYPHIHGVNQNNRHVDPRWEDLPPVNQHLQSAGYQTAHIGKIHMAHLEGKDHIRPGFDYWYSFIGQGVYFNPMVNDNGKEYQETGYMTDILTNKALEWLDNERDPSKPFYLNLWHKGVHEDHSPAPRHENLYSEHDLPTPPYDTHLETFKDKPEWQRIKAYDSEWKSYKPVPELSQKEWPIKGDKFMKLLRCLKAVDESLGTVMAKLEAMGELDNTVIIFSSDNGYFMGEHTYWDKRIAYENSMRIPMIISYPKLIEAGTDIDRISLNIDMAPTILDIAGIEIPSYMQGESMTPLFAKETADWREEFLFEYYVDDAYPYAGPDMLAVRTDRYKLVDNDLENDIDELYDLEVDPGEMNNLIEDSAYDSLEMVLRAKIEDLKVKYDYNPERDWWLKKVVANKKKK
ncbi:MAG: sulfatase [Cyclobacteriaceae bacterium]